MKVFAIARGKRLVAFERGRSNYGVAPVRPVLEHKRFHQPNCRRRNPLGDGNHLREKVSNHSLYIPQVVSVACAKNQLHVGNCRDIPILGSHAVDELGGGAMSAMHPNEDVGIENQRRYLGLRIFLSQAWTSFMSSRSAHIPKAG